MLTPPLCFMCVSSCLCVHLGTAILLLPSTDTPANHQLLSSGKINSPAPHSSPDDQIVPTPRWYLMIPFSLCLRIIVWIISVYSIWLPYPADPQSSLHFIICSGSPSKPLLLFTLLPIPQLVHTPLSFMSLHLIVAIIPILFPLCLAADVYINGGQSANSQFANFQIIIKFPHMMQCS